MEIQSAPSGCRLFGDRISCNAGRCRHSEIGTKYSQLNQHDRKERRLTLRFHLIAIIISDVYRY